jgi:hypothetical protein
MTEVRIARRTAQPVQAGPARLDEWVLEFAPVDPPEVDLLMGWLSSTDVRQQVRIGFPTLETALAYCRRQGWEATVETPPRRPRRRGYADNFVPLEDGTEKPIWPH